MKKSLLYILILILCLGVISACSSSGETSITDTNGHTAPATPTPVPSVSPKPTATPKPSPSPSPSPTPSPTPMPVFEDIITETEEAGLYSVPCNDISGYFLNVETLGDYIIYFNNEGVDTPPEIISYNILTGNTVRRTFDDFNPSVYSFTVIPDKYIMLQNGTHEMYFIDGDLKDLYSFEIPIESTYPEYVASPDYSKIYYFKNKILYECSTSTGETKELYADKRLNEAYTSRVTPDGNYVVFYMYTRTTGYYQEYLFDLKKNELISPPTSEKYYNYSISPDGKEFFLSIPDLSYVGLYVTGKDPKEALCALHSGGTIPDGLEKNSYKFRSSDEYYNAKVDWERRLVIVRDHFTRNSNFILVMTCYDLDTGAAVSNLTLNIENPISQDPRITYDLKRGYALISGAVLKEPYCYAWNYADDDLEKETSDFLRYDYIPKYIDDYRRELEEKYGVFIYLGTEIFATEHDYTLAYSGDFARADEVLHMLDEVFSIYPEDIFEQLKFDKIKTIGIYLCGGFTKKASYGIDNAIALTGIDGYELFLAFDISYMGDIRKNIFHEMSHCIDKKIESYGEATGEFDFTVEWDKNNPEDFYYMEDYNKVSPFSNYICSYSTKLENHYFIDTYALTKATEDRARLFEYLMRYDGFEYLESEHLRTKLHTYFDYLRISFNTENWPEETLWEYKLRLLDRYYTEDQNVSLENIYPEYYNGDIEYQFTDSGYGFLSAYYNSYG